MKLYLKNIVDSIPAEKLPPEWFSFDFVKFSNKKKLFDYQQQALKNAVKALYLFYHECEQKKALLFDLYRNNGFNENLDLKINKGKRFKILQEFGKDYDINDSKIPFYNFINRMSFWMATGSGKTLVIVKLIEILGNLIKNNAIPNNNILFLTYREDLIDQFKDHVYEFNSSNNSFYLNLYNLKDYDEVKRENRLKFYNEIDVFYYRSDLVSDEQKDKIIDFRNYDNYGKWFVILDEAHKGDKEESKRQLYYSILSRNGFLFNFSATFTDPIDYATCVFNFNLEKFIQQGYGKHIFISTGSVKGLGKTGEFSEEQKQLIILKIFLLHTLIKKSKPDKYYHNPLILTLVNTVNERESDLFLFFREVEKIASGNVSAELLTKAKEELLNDLQGQYMFETEGVQFDYTSLRELTLDDILENVYNAKIGGKIEVLKIPGNKQELVFKLTTTERPFALIKIGDISEWIRNKLTGYQIIDKYDDESVFRKLNRDDSDINLLMGSRAFYEGWDSNRPNIILYINIGTGTDAKKFVLQSVGRGVRIEPAPTKRQRLQFLYNKNEFDKSEYEEIKNDVRLIETLFVYGTKAENLREVIQTLKEEKQEEVIGDLFIINPDIKDKLLLIPVYKECDKELADGNPSIKFEINEQDLELIKNYYCYIGSKVALLKYDCQPRILRKIEEALRNDEEFFKKSSDFGKIGKAEVLFRKIIEHFSTKFEELKEFKQLENEIIHFKQIKLTEKNRQIIEQKIKQVLEYREKDKVISEIATKIQQEPQKALEFVRELEEISKNFPKESDVEFQNGKIKFKYLTNHYYLPVAISESEREHYLIHVIKTKSEVNFLNELEKYLQQDNNIFKEFDWWFFSKIDETLDEVYIPYYQPKTNKIEKFVPDFIFWFKKGYNYTIVFVDPKGTEHVDGYRKIEGYSKIFEENKNGRKEPKAYLYRTKEEDCLKINVKLFFFTKEINKVLEEYKKYWYDNVKDLFEILVRAANDT